MNAYPYYGMDGQRIDRDESARLFDDPTLRRVGRDERDGVTVSTVLLVISHQWDDAGPPVIFETMIFGGDHDEYQERYCTLAEAQAGHAAACTLAFGDAA